MRVIGGEWRGRVIHAPSGLSTRPTGDRVRETLFNMLASRLDSFDDLLIADLFAGSGALGFEALSRGASRATFVEQDSRVAALIKANAEKLGATDRVEVLRVSALSLPTHHPFDLVLADPPYGPGSGGVVAGAVASAGWLARGGWMSVETADDDSVDAGPFAIEATRTVGRSRLTLLRHL